jgi:hypothetical protein
MDIFKGIQNKLLKIKQFATQKKSKKNIESENSEFLLQKN